MEIYDFALNWNSVKEDVFVRLSRERCEKRKMKFLWINDDNIKQVILDLNQRKTKIRVLLDTDATFNKKDDLYARVCYMVKDLGGVVINDPDRSKNAIDKSIMHFELMNSNITTPYTIVVRNWEPKKFRLSNEEKRRLGTPFIIKPAQGYGQLGVVREAKGSIKEIAKARKYDRGDNFLLQEKISPISLGGRRAWFRVINVFETIIPCWWDDQEQDYEHVTMEEFNRYRLYPLARISSKISAISRVVWFSSEIAIDRKNGKNRFVVIDYVNDQCDMTTKSEWPKGVPDAVVEYNAKRIVDAAYQFIHGEKLSKKFTIFLKDAKIELRGLGTSQDFLKQTILDRIEEEHVETQQGSNIKK